MNCEHILTVIRVSPTSYCEFYFLTSTPLCCACVDICYVSCKTKTDDICVCRL